MLLYRNRRQKQPVFSVFFRPWMKREKTVHTISILKTKGDGSMDVLSLILVIIGAVNWGLVGFARFDLVAWIFGGQTAVLSRIIYTLVALAGVWCISLLFRSDDDAVEVTNN